jgi:hypothetical protein
MRTKTAVWCIVLVLLCSTAFSAAHLQGSMSVLFLSYSHTESSDDEGPPTIPFVGLTGDFLVSLGGPAELGAEIGIFTFILPLPFIMLTVTEVPLDALLRLNLSPDRKVALELRGGLWLSIIAADTSWGDSGSASFTQVHFGGRFLIDWFYLGGDYIAQSESINSAFAFEIGVKASYAAP